MRAPTSRELSGADLVTGRAEKKGSRWQAKGAPASEHDGHGIAENDSDFWTVIFFLVVAWTIGCVCGWLFNSAHRKLMKWWRRSPKPKPTVASSVTLGTAVGAGTTGLKPAPLSKPTTRASASVSLKGVFITKYGSVAHVIGSCSSLKCATTTIREYPLCQICGDIARMKAVEID